MFISSKVCVAFIGIAAIMVSCGSNANVETDIQKKDSIAANIEAPANDTNKPFPNIVLPTSPAAPVVSNTSGLNPEHGKPGHRCDIAVGSPLDSKPVAPSIQPQAPVTIPAPSTINTTPVTTGKGLNPEHGKPGHRCDIAVGAPLDSKPAAVTNTPASPVTISPNATLPKPVSVTPSPATNPTTPAITGAGLNPEHGKPGHRCDIAVGAPLPKQ